MNDIVYQTALQKADLAYNAWLKEAERYATAPATVKARDEYVAALVNLHKACQRMAKRNPAEA